MINPICDARYREGNPDFTSSSPLSGRLLFVRRGTDRTWMWGGSGSLLLNLCWAAILRSISSHNSDAGAGIFGSGGVYGPPGSADRRGFSWTSNSLAWDDNLTRGLWLFYLHAWHDQTVRMRQPSAVDQLLGRATADYTRDWISKLNSIRSVETSRRITPSVFKLAAMAALSHQDLLDNVTTPLVDLLPTTRLPDYGRPVPVVTIVSENLHSSLIWPAGSPFPMDPKWVSRNGVIRDVACNPHADQPAIIPTSSSNPAHSSPPSSAQRPASNRTPVRNPTRDAFSDISEPDPNRISDIGYNVFYVLGGAMVLGGAALAAFSLRSGSDRS